MGNIPSPAIIYSARAQSGAPGALWSGANKLDLIPRADRLVRSWVSGSCRAPLLADVRRAARLGDALDNISIVGAMGVPSDVPLSVRDVVLTAELARHTTKPTRAASRSIATAASTSWRSMPPLPEGKRALRRSPMTEVYLDPVSPLTFSEYRARDRHAIHLLRAAGEHTRHAHGRRYRTSHPRLVPSPRLMPRSWLASPLSRRWHQATRSCTLASPT